MPWLPLGLLKLTAVVGTAGTIAFAGYSATRPPAVTTSGRAEQAAKQAEQARDLRQKNRRYELPRDLDNERARRARPGEQRPPVAQPSRLQRLLRGLPRPRVRFRLR